MALLQHVLVVSDAHQRPGTALSQVVPAVQAHATSIGVLSARIANPCQPGTCGPAHKPMHAAPGSLLACIVFHYAGNLPYNM